MWIDAHTGAVSKIRLVASFDLALRKAGVRVQEWAEQHAAAWGQARKWVVAADPSRVYATLRETGVRPSRASAAARDSSPEPVAERPRARPATLEPSLCNPLQSIASWRLLWKTDHRPAGIVKRHWNQRQCRSRWLREPSALEALQKAFLTLTQHDDGGDADRQSPSRWLKPAVLPPWGE